MPASKFYENWKTLLPGLALATMFCAITPQEAKTHKFRNVLYRYLGSKEVGENIDVKLIPLRAGERLLLCTDGPHGVVPDNGLLEAMRPARDVQECADGLCKLAIKSGSRDNVSCIVIATTP